jgi:hypothetical protein
MVRWEVRLSRQLVLCGLLTMLRVREVASEDNWHFHTRPLQEAREAVFTLPVSPSTASGSGPATFRFVRVMVVRPC